MAIAYVLISSLPSHSVRRVVRSVHPCNKRK